MVNPPNYVKEPMRCATGWSLCAAISTRICADEHIGAGNKAKGTNEPHDSPRFRIEEAYCRSVGSPACG
ncbi:MAG: hypothetical protein KatS3mg052_0927 [Candidatus Roseilinea sp.]|nr:MAG: hypothetical protein KatS3mg052_0927 [Candidatus Roseilinea sp.]